MTWVWLLGQTIRLKWCEVTETFIVVVCGVRKCSGSLASLVYVIFLLTLREATRWEELSAEMGRWMWSNLSVLTKEKHVSVEVGLKLHFIHAMSESKCLCVNCLFVYCCLWYIRMIVLLFSSKELFSSLLLYRAWSAHVKTHQSHYPIILLSIFIFHMVWIHILYMDHQFGNRRLKHMSIRKQLMSTIPHSLPKRLFKINLWLIFLWKHREDIIVYTNNI